jgi:WD40 repeat protein
VWDGQTGQEAFSLQGHTARVNSVCFSPDGRRLASSSEDKTVRLWDVHTSQELLTLKGHTSVVRSVCFSPDGRRLASSSEDQTVKVWDAQTGQEVLTLKGHTSGVNSVCFSPDGRRLASASSDGTVKVWDAQTGQEALSLKGHTGRVADVCFSPDGTVLASASVDGTVRLWEAPLQVTAGESDRRGKPARTEPPRPTANDRQVPGQSNLPPAPAAVPREDRLPRREESDAGNPTAAADKAPVAASPKAAGTDQPFDDLGPTQIKAALFGAPTGKINGAGNPGNQLLPGTVVVYVTNEDRYGKFKVMDCSSDLAIKWVTYAPDGSVFSHGDRLVVRASWTCDLDGGKEGPAGKSLPDFSWEMGNTTTRHLLPSNGALFSVYPPQGPAAEEKVPSPVVDLRPTGQKQDHYLAGRATAIHLPYAYVLARTGDLWTFRLPEKLGEERNREILELAELPGAGDGTALVVIGDTLLCSSIGSLAVYSLRDPEKPRRVAVVGPAAPGPAYAMIRQGDRLVMVGPGCLSVFDVTNPSTPQHLGITRPARVLWNGCAVGDRLYLAEIRSPTVQPGGHDGIVVYDLADPKDPKELGFVETAAQPYHLLAVDKDRLVVLTDKEAQLFTLANPLKPAPLSQPVAASGRAGAVLCSDGHAYLVTGGQVFRIEAKALVRIQNFRSGPCYDGLPYHGCSLGEYVAIPGQERTVILQAKARFVARPDSPAQPGALAPAGPSVPIREQSEAGNPPGAGEKAPAGRAPGAQRLAGHTGAVFSLAYAPDGKLLASGSQDGTVRLWDTAAGKERFTLRAHDGEVLAVAFSPDGQLLVSGGKEGLAKVWDVKTGQERFSLPRHQGAVTSVAFSPDGKRLASAGDGRTAKVWELATRQSVHSLEGHGSFVQAVAFSPDGKVLATGSADFALRLWDAATGQLLGTYRRHHGGIRSVSFSPDGKYLATASHDNTVKLWDPTTGDEIRTLIGHRGFVASLAFSPDSKRLASVASHDHQIRVWDADTGKVMFTLPGDAAIGWCVAFRPDGRYLAAAGEDSVIKVWEAHSP